ncbi:MAG: hypothetical protein KA116_00340 [Proteobacteria bacterium]|nr:hypothetical protein [Pseudomonadota bacterium]
MSIRLFSILIFIGWSFNLYSQAFEYSELDKEKPQEIIPEELIVQESKSQSIETKVQYVDNRSILKEGIHVLFAPMQTMMMPLNYRMAYKMNREEALKATAEEAPPYLVAHALLYWGLGKVSKVYYKINYDDFHQKVSAKLNPNPESVLFINTIDAKDKLGDYPALEFERLYAKSSSEYLEAESIDDLKRKLKDLEKGAKTFDRIEFWGHGHPGRLAIGKKDKLSLKNLNLLSDMKLNITKPGAEIRMISCSLSGKSPFHNGEDFLTQFGKSLLPHGGRIFGATRDILVYDTPLPMKFLQHAYGVALWSRLFHETLPKVLRDYKQAKHDFVEVQIPANCESTLAKIIRHE